MDTVPASGKGAADGGGASLAAAARELVEVGVGVRVDVSEGVSVREGVLEGVKEGVSEVVGV